MIKKNKIVFINKINNLLLRILLGIFNLFVNFGIFIIINELKILDFRIFFIVIFGFFFLVVEMVIISFGNDVLSVIVFKVINFLLIFNILEILVIDLIV